MQLKLKQDQKSKRTMNAKRVVNFVLGEKREWWCNYYLMDWAAIIILVIIGGIVEISVYPYDRYRPDTFESYPLKPSIIPDWLLAVLTLPIPILFYVMMQYVERSRHDLHHALLGHLTGWILTFFFTELSKKLTGRYRPDWNPDDNDTMDARQSFPSGHSSTSFAAMVFVSLYLCGKLRILSQHGGPMVVKAFVSFLPIALAGFIAISRTMDYHHNFSDILAGALLGSGMAMFSYYMYYPSLFSDQCSVPRSKLDYTSSSSEHEVDIENGNS